jgi:hypothetical protein
MIKTVMLSNYTTDVEWNKSEGENWRRKTEPVERRSGAERQRGSVGYKPFLERGNRLPLVGRHC